MPKRDHIEPAARAAERLARADIELGNMTPLPHIARSRPAPAVEPVDVVLVNWRRPERWETVLIIKARHEARAREAAQLAGLT